MKVQLIVELACLAEILNQLDSAVRLVAKRFMLILSMVKIQKSQARKQNGGESDKRYSYLKAQFLIEFILLSV